MRRDDPRALARGDGDDPLRREGELVPRMPMRLDDGAVRILGGDSRANLVVARVKEALTLCRHWLALYRKTATSGTASEYLISFEVRFIGGLTGWDDTPATDEIVVWTCVALGYPVADTVLQIERWLQSRKRAAA